MLLRRLNYRDISNRDIRFFYSYDEDVPPLSFARMFIDHEFLNTVTIQSVTRKKKV